MGSDCRPDPDPIIDEGPPTSTGGMINAAALCDQICIALHVENPRAQYLHGWGEQCKDTKPIRCSYSLKITDASNWPATLTFDLVNGISPLIVGMDVRHYPDTCNRKWHHTISFKRPYDTRDYTLYTYIGDDDTGNRRLRLEITPHADTAVSTIMGNAHSRRERNIAERIDRFGHAAAAEMRELLSGTDLDEAKLRKACEDV